MRRKEVENFLYFDLEYEDNNKKKNKNKRKNEKNKKQEEQKKKDEEKVKKNKKEKKAKKDNKEKNKDIENNTKKEKIKAEYDELEIEIPIIKKEEIKKVENKRKKNKIKNRNEEDIPLSKNRRLPSKELNKNKKSNKKNNTKKINEKQEDIFNVDNEFIIGVSNKNSRKNTLSKEEIAQIRVKKEIRIKKIKTVFIVGIIIFAVFFTLYSPIFNITDIQVINNNNISQQEIISLSGIQKGENTFKLFKGEIINKIKENPYVENVTIRRVLPGTVQIEIEERTAAFMLEYANAYVYINTQGYILEISTQRRELPIITGFTTKQEEIKINNRLCLEDLEKINTVLKIIKVATDNDVVSYITKIDISDDSDYVLILEGENKKAYIGDCSDLITRMLYVKELIEKEKGKPGEIFVNKNLNTQYPMFRESV